MNRSVRLGFLFAAAALPAHGAVGEVAAAPTPAFTLTSAPTYFSPAQDGNEYSMGFEFTTTQPFLVTDLGFNANGAFAGTHAVGIYSLDNPATAGVNESALLTSDTVTVPAGGSGQTDFVYETLDTPLSLAPGTYRVAGTTFDTSAAGAPSTQGYNYATTPFAGISETAGLDYVRGRFTVSNSLAYPTETALDFFVVNFKVSPVPEPASLGLLASGALPLLARRRRR